MMLISLSGKSVLSVVLLGCLLSAAAQGPALSPPPKRKYKHASKIETTFDKSKNLTTVRLNRMNIWTNAAYSNIIDLSFSFDYAGQTPATPKKVTLVILGKTADGSFSDKRDLVIRADSYALDFGEMELLQSTAFPAGYAQILATVMPYEIFLRIANARKLEVKLRNTKYLITDEQLEAIQDLASRTAP